MVPVYFLHTIFRCAFVILDHFDRKKKLKLSQYSIQCSVLLGITCAWYKYRTLQFLQRQNNIVQCYLLEHPTTKENYNKNINLDCIIAY